MKKRHQITPVARLVPGVQRFLRFFFFLIMFAVLLLAGCAGHKAALRDWQELPAAQYAIPPYAAYLAAFKIALDPGHGGLSHLPGYKRGPTGKEESVMNLNVARFLKEFLEQAGARVMLTRADDRFVSLQDRADLAAAAGCDFMISLHHNAGENPAANYAAVFYHLHPDYSPMSMDLARHVYFGIVEALRLPQMSPEGLLSDQLIYPAGFGLLRVSRIPAILLESSFYSDPAEEKRLTDLAYNRREAYGIFLGLARWAAGGVPRARMLLPSAVSRTKKPEIVYALSDGVAQRANRPNAQLLIFSSSVTMRLDGKLVAARLDLAQRRLSYQPDSALSNGVHLVQVDLQNLFKNHNLPRTDTLRIAAPTSEIQFATPSLRLPGDGTALMPIALQLHDAEGQPVWEGTGVNVYADRGRINLDPAPLQAGRGLAYYQAPVDTGAAYIIAEADGRRDTLALAIVPPGTMRVLSGVVSEDSSGARLGRAQIFLDDSLAAESDARGSFFVPALAAGTHRLEVRARGYAALQRDLVVPVAQSQIANARLRPLYDGVLYQQAIILDAAQGGMASGDPFAAGLNAAQANLNLTRALADSLLWAGAEVFMVREQDSTLSVPARVARVNQIPRGWYLKIGYQARKADSLLVQCTNYPGNQAGRRLAEAMATAFAALPSTRVSLEQNTRVPEVTLTNKMAVEVALVCRMPDLGRELSALFHGIIHFQYEEKHRAGREDPAAN